MYPQGQRNQKWSGKPSSDPLVTPHKLLVSSDGIAA